MNLDWERLRNAVKRICDERLVLHKMPKPLQPYGP